MDTSSFFIYPTSQTDPSEVTSGFLDGATEAEWTTLLSYVQTRYVRTGETVFTEGDIDRTLFILTAGRLEQSSQRTAVVVVEGPAPLNEVAFLDGGRCTATARAVTDCEVLRLSFDAFESMAAREPVLARRMLLDLGAGVARSLRASAGGVVAR
jgi:CRP/FNR family transcriptional regulator, cyclic AMP receptor protein